MCIRYRKSFGRGLNFAGWAGVPPVLSAGPQMTNTAEDPISFVKCDVPELTQVKYSEMNT